MVRPVGVPSGDSGGSGYGGRGVDLVWVTRTDFKVNDERIYESVFVNQVPVDLVKFPFTWRVCDQNTTPLPHVQAHVVHRYNVRNCSEMGKTGQKVLIPTR